MVFGFRLKAGHMFVTRDPSFAARRGMKDHGHPEMAPEALGDHREVWRCTRVTRLEPSKVPPPRGTAPLFSDLALDVWFQG